VPTFLQRIIKWMMIALVIAFALLVVYLVWLLLRSYWAPILLFSQLLVGAVFVAFFLFAQYAATANSTDDLLRIAAEVNAQLQTSRARLVATKVFGAINMLTGGWPIGIYAIISGLTRPNALSTMQIQAHESLQGKSHKLAPIILGFVILLYLASWLQPSTIYWNRILILILAINIISRHLTYAVHPLSLPTQLRRTIGSAYLTFAIIAISDFCVLILTFNAIENWGNGTIGSLAEGSLADLRVIFAGLFFGQISDLVFKIAQGHTPAVKEALLPSVGALFSYNLLETAYKFSDFRRNDADFLAIAEANILLGKYNDALGALAQVKDKGGSWYQLRSVAYLGVLQVGKAWENIERSLMAKRMDSENRGITKEDIFLEGVGAWVILPTEAKVAWLRYGIESKLTDFYLAFGLNMMIYTKSDIPTPEAVFRTTVIESNYPLSHVVFLMAQRNLDSARTQLDQIQTTGLPETLFRQLLILQSHLLDKGTSLEEDSLYFSNWSASNLNLLAEIEWKTLTTAELTVMLFCFSACNSFSAEFKSAYLQTWMYQSNELKKHLPLSSLENKFLERLEPSMNSTLA
jgi:hypothetical protein